MLHALENEIDDLGLANKLAKEVVSRKLHTLVLFFLESHLPVRGLIYNGLIMASPLIVPFFGASQIKAMLYILEEEKRIKLLVSAIEDALKK